MIHEKLDETVDVILNVIFIEYLFQARLAN